MDEDIQCAIDDAMEALDAVSSTLLEFPETKKYADRIDRIYRELENLQEQDEEIDEEAQY